MNSEEGNEADGLRGSFKNAKRRKKKLRNEEKETRERKLESKNLEKGKAFKNETI
jgi:hypothetical protein